VLADPDEHDEALRRRAEIIARAVARSKPLPKEKREQVVSLLAKPRRQGAA
jgi:hypothetical protein